MRKLHYLLAIATGMGLLAASQLVSAAHAQDESGTKTSMPDPKPALVTVEGTLVDSRCYEKSVALGMPHPNVGNDHMTPDGVMKACATKCAKRGIPVAVLQADGKLFIIAAPAKAFASYMAHQVRVTGMAPFAGSIVPTKVEVRSVDGQWKEVDITTMM